MPVTITPLGPEGLVSLDTIRSLMGYDSSVTTDDDRLRDFIAEASAAFEGECGQAIRASVTTFTFSGAGRTIHTPAYHPLSSLTSLERYDGTGTWTALDEDDYRLVDFGNGDFQQIEYDGGFVMRARYRATCTVGYTSIPQDVQTAVAQRVILDILDMNVTKGDARLGMASKTTTNAQGIQNAAITFSKADVERRWAQTVARYRRLP